jgi:hypothetical protein
MPSFSLPDLGPYALDYTRSGRYLLVGGWKGHLAIMDWARAKLVTELQVKETTRDVQFLHNESFFAAAQKKYVYVYDKRGIEVHCLKVRKRLRNKVRFSRVFLWSAFICRRKVGVLHWSPLAAMRKRCTCTTSGASMCTVSR